MKGKSNLAWLLILTLLFVVCLPATVLAAEGTFTPEDNPVTVRRTAEGMYTVQVNASYFSNATVTMAAISLGSDISVLETDPTKVFYAAEKTADATGSAVFSFFTDGQPFYVAVGSEKDILFTENATSLSYIKAYVTTYNVMVSAGDNGTVEPYGISAVEENTAFTVTVTPAEGYIIDALTMNEVPVEVNSEGKYTVTVTGETAIHATFREADVMSPSVSLPAEHAFIGSDGNEVITFAQISEKSEYSILDYGIIYGKTKTELEEPTEQVQKLSAKSRNSKGQYGIRLIGDLSLLGGSFYTRAYIIYQKDGETPVTVYSDAILAVTL